MRVRNRRRFLFLVPFAVSLLSLLCGPSISRVPSAAEEGAITRLEKKFNDAVTLYSTKKYRQAISILENLERLVDRVPGELRRKLMYRIGIVHEDGAAVVQNYKLAFSYYQRSAQEGHIGAQFKVGSMHQTGKGVGGKSVPLAKWWYIRAARQGSGAAHLELGKILEAEGELTQAHTHFNVAYYILSSRASTPLPPGARREAQGRRNSLEETLSLVDVARAQEAAAKWRRLAWLPNGSAFFITKSGHLLTNHHVIDGCDEVTVQRASEGSLVPAEVLKSSRDDDLALLQIADPKDVTTALFPNEDYTLEIATDVMVVGYPFPGLVVPMISTEPNVTKGSVSSLDPARSSRYFQTTAPIQGGNSGGPILNAKGK